MAVQRFGMVIGVREEKVDEYKAVHADEHPGVRDLLERANMRNFSIFIERLPDGKLYLFGYYEYHGTDREGDMHRLAEDPRNVEWLAMTDPMQIPLPGEASWRMMEQVYFNA